MSSDNKNTITISRVELEHIYGKIKSVSDENKKLKKELEKKSVVIDFVTIYLLDIRETFESHRKDMVMFERNIKNIFNRIGGG